MTKIFGVAFVSALLLATGCAPKRQVQAPVPAPVPAPPSPQPKNLVVLLPDATGKSSSITVTNSAGTQVIAQPYQAIRIAGPDTAPSPPSTMDEAEVRRIFGSVLDALPAPEAAFTLYFGEDKDVLSSEDEAKLPSILNAIQQRRSTAISVVGHTDTTKDRQYNYELGLRRARAVAAILRTRGVDGSVISIESHGEADQAVPTARGVAERRNRRVEVIVR